MIRANRGLIEEYKTSPYDPHAHKIEYAEQIDRLHKIDSSLVKKGIINTFNNYDEGMDIFRELYNALDVYTTHKHHNEKNIAGLKDGWMNLTDKAKDMTFEIRYKVQDILCIKALKDSVSEKHITLLTSIYNQYQDVIGESASLSRHRDLLILPIIKHFSNLNSLETEVLRVHQLCQKVELVFLDIKIKAREFKVVIDRLDNDVEELNYEVVALIQNFDSDFSLNRCTVN